LNISSFLLGTPEQLKLHNNKALRQIQNKNRFIIEELKEERFSYDENYTEETYRYKLKNNNYFLKQILSIIKRQKHNLYKRLKIGNGFTNLNIRVRFHRYPYNL